MKPSTDREAITLIIEGLAAKGLVCYMVQDDTYAQDIESNVMCSTVEEAVEACTGVDEAFAYFAKNSAPADKNDHDGYIYFVLGNDPEEVACDYSVILSDYLDPIVEPWWS